MNYLSEPAHGWEVMLHEDMKYCSTVKNPLLSTQNCKHCCVMVGENKILTSEISLCLYVVSSQDAGPQSVWQIAFLTAETAGSRADSHLYLTSRPPAGEDLYQADPAQTQEKCRKCVLNPCVLHLCTGDRQALFALHVLFNLHQ